MKPFSLALIASLFLLALNAHASTPGQVLQRLNNNQMVQGALAEMQRLIGPNSTCTGLQIDTFTTDDTGYFSVTAHALCDDEENAEPYGGSAVILNLEAESLGGDMLVRKIKLDFAG